MTDTKIIDGGTSQQDFTDREMTDGEKTFTQSQLEEIISERLARERKANASLGEVKRLLRSAHEGGFIKGGSYVEMAKQLIDAVTAGACNADKDGSDESETPLQEGECEAQEPCDKASSGADEEGQNTEQTDFGENGRQGTQTDISDAENFVRVISDLKEKFGEREIERMLSGNLFANFAKGRKESLDETVSAFCSFMSCLYPNAELEDSDTGEDGNEELREQAPDFASTAFSVYSGTPASDMGLTRQQREIAKSAGMSYREYASLLEQAPKKTRR